MWARAAQLLPGCTPTMPILKRCPGMVFDLRLMNLRCRKYDAFPAKIRYMCGRSWRFCTYGGLGRRPAFPAVAQSGTLSGAARYLKVDHATVSRRLAALEAALDVKLVDRLPRACRLTSLGRQVFERAVEMETSVHSISRLAKAAFRTDHAQRAASARNTSFDRAFEALQGEVSRHPALTFRASTAGFPQPPGG
ncbi:LysR family transcriptional regulator [Rhizobium grahamii]|uniref:LysR family transcriptional regulator n=1 Tax=Rhizobium grahamii TaxID=1120045 RepID=UPI0011B0AA95